MNYEIETKIRELVHQAVTWEYALIHKLAELKKINGYVGAEKMLKKELMKYSKLTLPSCHYLMQLVSVLERLQRLGIIQGIYQRLPLSRWRELLAIATKENASELAEYLIEGGELNEVKKHYAKGLKLRYNLYLSEFEFITKDDENGNI